MSAIAKKMTQKDNEAVSAYYNRVRPTQPLPPETSPLLEPSTAPTQ